MFVGDRVCDCFQTPPMVVFNYPGMPRFCFLYHESVGIIAKRIDLFYGVMYSTSVSKGNRATNEIIEALTIVSFDIYQLSYRNAHAVVNS